MLGGVGGFGVLYKSFGLGFVAAGFGVSGYSVQGFLSLIFQEREGPGPWDLVLS